jgi:hypothetical protein
LLQFADAGHTAARTHVAPAAIMARTSYAE